MSSYIGFRPALLRVAAGDVFALDVVAEPPLDLYAAKLVLRWVDERVEYLGMSQGTHLRKGHFEETSHGCKMGVPEATPGSGWLATATFRARGVPCQTHIALRPSGCLVGEADETPVVWGRAEINIEERLPNRPVMALRLPEGDAVAVVDRALKVDVEVSNVHNLGRAWFTVTWNPELLKYRKATPGDFFDGRGGESRFLETAVGDGRTTFTVDRIAGPSGEAPPGVSGSGRLATLHFKPLASSHGSKERPRRAELGKTGLYLLARETGLWDMQAAADRPSRLRFYREALMVRVQKYARPRRGADERPGARKLARVRGEPKRTVVTGRDLDILQVAYEHGFITVEQMATFFPVKERASGRHSPATYRRDRELVVAGLLERYRPKVRADRDDGGEPDVKFRGGLRLITAEGVRALVENGRAAEVLERVTAPTPHTFTHNRIVLDLRLDLQARGFPYEWIPERVVRRRWQAGDTMLRFAPDAILVRPDGLLPLALEFERKPKDWRKYEEYLVRYRRLIPIKGLAWVLLVVPEEGHRQWLLGTAWTSAMREIRADAERMKEVGSVIPVDYFKVVLLEDLRRAGEQATAVWMAPSGRVETDTLATQTEAASWGGQALESPMVYLRVIQDHLVIAAKQPGTYVEYLRLRDHEREWGKIDKMLRTERLLAVEHGTEVLLSSRKLHRVNASFQLPMVLVRIRNGAHVGKEGWVHEAHFNEYGDDERGAGFLAAPATKGKEARPRGNAPRSS